MFFILVVFQLALDHRQTSVTNTQTLSYSLIKVTLSRKHLTVFSVEVILFHPFVVQAFVIGLMLITPPSRFFLNLRQGSDRLSKAVYDSVMPCDAFVVRTTYKGRIAPPTAIALKVYYEPVESPHVVV
jgi:hypothetical protein